MALLFRKPKGRNQRTLVCEGINRLELGEGVQKTVRAEGVGLELCGLDGKKYHFELFLDWDEIDFINDQRLVLLAGRQKEKGEPVEIGLLWGMLLGWLGATLRRWRAPRPEVEALADAHVGVWLVEQIQQRADVKPWSRVSFTRAKNPLKDASFAEKMQKNGYRWSDGSYHTYNYRY